MTGLVPHPWKISIAEAARLQRELRDLVEETDRLGDVRLLAGFDLSGVRLGGKATAAAVLLSFPELKLVDESRAEGVPDFPYVPGYLSFRESPLLIKALEGLAREPDLVLVDGHGRAHPRRFGIACHLGLLLDKPTIGCAKSLLLGRYDELGLERGATAPLMDEEEVIGTVLRTRSGVKPIFVTVGHRVSLATAVGFVMGCTLPGRRLPEPTRLAHELAGRKELDK